MAGGISFARKASSRLVPRDAGESRDGNKQICSRLGCGSKTSSSEVKHTQSPPSSKQVAKSSSSSLSNPRQLRLNPCDKVLQHDVSGEASSSSSSSNPHSRDLKRTMRKSDQGSSKKGASMSKYSFRNIRSNLGKKRTSEVECNVSARGKEISRTQLDDRSQTLHGGISISNPTRPSNNSTSVGIQRSDAGATRRLNEGEADLGQYSMNEIAEMLIALERIEQDEEVSYEEQWLVLETNLFLSGLTSRDQHREMRLDIDNMSYEELLALEERMGSVSTALPEEAIEKCVEKIINRITEQGSPSQGDEIKCSICQEEYKERNEAGKLRCEHIYHVECIKKWLRLKNWCPVCKASVAP